jgi:predicted amidohydrolase
MKIAAAQSIITRDPSENGAAIRALMRQAADAGARLVQFTEGALSSYPLRCEEADWSAVALELTQIAALAAELKLWTVVGSAHRVSPNRPHNSLYVISDLGEIATRYDKRLCSNNEINTFYSPGFDPVVFEVDGFRFGLALCIEVNFPELFMEYERLGVDCVLFSAHSGDAMFGVMAQGHAATNCLWFGVSTPAQAWALPSGVIGPDGRWMAQAAGQIAPGIVATELDRADPRFDVALNKARPWRRVAREGAIYAARRAGDPSSEKK